MTPPCRKIKYKERRSSKPVVRIRKKPHEPSFIHESSVSISGESEQLYLGEAEIIEEPMKSVVNLIDCFKIWLRKQKFIPQDLSDAFLMFFLSASGNDLELAKRKLEKYFQSRQDPSPIFRDRDLFSPANIKIFKKLFVLPLPGTTVDGRKIILTGLQEPMQNYNQINHLKVMAMVFDLLIWEKDFGFGDFVIVFDGNGFECPQLLENKVHNHRSIKSLLLDTIPGTLRSFYFLQPPLHVANVADNRNGIWFTVLKFKKQLVRHLPANMLPLEYGGNAGRMKNLLEQWNIHMIQNRNFFVLFEKQMINYYNRRLFYEKELASRGKNWVQDMKLEADEWEYKIQYYNKMQNMKPVYHRAFGPNRIINQNKCNKPASSTKVHKCLQTAKEDQNRERQMNLTEFDRLFQKMLPEGGRDGEIGKEKPKTLCGGHQPILELQIFYY